MLGGLFGKKKPSKDEGGEKKPPASTVTGALVQRPADGSIAGDALKGIIESAAMNQPQLAEHVTTQIVNYIADVVEEPFQSIFMTALAPAVLMGDASNKELADIMTELYVNRLRFTSGPRIVSHTLAIDYDLQYAASLPILRLAKKSHLLHVALRYGPIVMEDD